MCTFSIRGGIRGRGAGDRSGAPDWQTRRVIATRLVARNTIEEKILQLQASKRALADAILGQDQGRAAQDWASRVGVVVELIVVYADARWHRDVHGEPQL
jgi:hypothetical protein